LTSPGRSNPEVRRAYLGFILLKTAVDVAIHLAVDLREQSFRIGATPAASLT
jgi:hypothetical protein